jgi:hypothetical protein
VKAITVRQPWAWLIVNGGKNVENREWMLAIDLIGERVGLHAAKWWNTDAVVMFLNSVRPFVDPPLPADLTPILDEMRAQTGRVIATMQVVGVVDDRGGKARPHSLTADRAAIYTTSPWRIPGDVAFCLRGVRRTTSAPIRGLLNFWTLNAAEIAEIRANEERP